MGDGAVSGHNPRGEWHCQRPQRLGEGSRQSEIYSRFAVERDQCQCADGGVGRSTAEGEV